jgi:hypothetical protein
VNTFINLDQDSLSADIQDIVDIAQEEAKIEDELTVIRKRWEDRKFVLTREQVGPNSPKLTIINQVRQFYEFVNIFAKKFLQTHPPITKAIRFFHTLFASTCFNPELGPL